MNVPVPYKVQGQQCWLSPDRMIFWEAQKALIVADLHFGKTGHFRKAGIAVPQAVYKEDLQRLVCQLQHFQPAQLIVVGDMFHSRANKELELFKKWRHDFPDLGIRLIKGNHDILHDNWYTELNITTCDHSLQINDFVFTHDPTVPVEDCLPAEIRQLAEKAGPLLPVAPPLPAPSYLFSGHIHPGIRISGIGKQALRFPCFYFTKEYCILPAFSRFTGTALVDTGAAEAVFAIVNSSIIRF